MDVDASDRRVHRICLVKNKASERHPPLGSHRCLAWHLHAPCKDQRQTDEGFLLDTTDTTVEEAGSEDMDAMLSTNAVAGRMAAPLEKTPLATSIQRWNVVALEAAIACHGLVSLV
ncbi:hypothetical protein VTN00DRAFT_2784 [Thermoascus crustaceus]|uniref:uncharacterized protein n=1 Tax=Thermoascus crustaceus TaxID=5088 RepID=UPI003743EF13